MGEASCTTISLVVHELATNSIKYGALSKDTGRVAMTCTADDREAVLTWKEHGGPAVTSPVGPVGFGSQLVAKSIASQLGGTIAFDWATDGVVITLRMSKARLGA